MANGLACVNLAFSHDVVVSRVAKDMPQFKDRISEISSRYSDENHIQNEST